MKDIVSVANDIGLFDSDVARAKNILSIQVGSLEYEPDFGIDLEYFLSEDFKFQNESFKAYLVDVLANRGVNVSSVAETLQSLFTELTFNLTSDQNSTGLIAR
jgi:hypothetical protein